MSQNKEYIDNIFQPYKFLRQLGFRKFYLSFVYRNYEYEEANLIPIILLQIYYFYNFVVKFKNMFSRTNSVNLTRSLFSIYNGALSYNFLNFDSKIVSFCDRLGYRMSYIWSY